MPLLAFLFILWITVQLQVKDHLLLNLSPIFESFELFRGDCLWTMNDVFIGFDGPKYLAQWTLNMLDMKLSPAVQTIPHILDQVLIASNFLVRAILTDEVGRH